MLVRHNLAERSALFVDYLDELARSPYNPVHDSFLVVIVVENLSACPGVVRGTLHFPFPFPLAVIIPDRTIFTTSLAIGLTRFSSLR